MNSFYGWQLRADIALTLFMASSFPNPSFPHCSFLISNSTSSTHFPLSYPPTSLTVFPQISSTKNGSVSKIHGKFEKFQGETPQDDVLDANPSSSLQQQLSQEVEEDDRFLFFSSSSIFVYWILELIMERFSFALNWLKYK